MNARRALLAYLKRNDIRQAALARATGVSGPSISLLLSDPERLPGLALAIAIERETHGAVPATSWLSPPRRS